MRYLPLDPELNQHRKVLQPELEPTNFRATNPRRRISCIHTDQLWNQTSRQVVLLEPAFCFATTGKVFAASARCFIATVSGDGGISAGIGDVFCWYCI